MTKLRVIFVENGNVSNGSRAIRQLCQAVRRKVLDVAWPVGFESFTTERKLSFLGSILPEKSKLILIREMKHTRKNRSKYVETLTKLMKTNLPTANDVFTINLGNTTVNANSTPITHVNWRTRLESTRTTNAEQLPLMQNRLPEEQI